MKAYAVKAATNAQSAKQLIEEGWGYTGKIENVVLFRKQISG